MVALARSSEVHLSERKLSFDARSQRCVLETISLRNRGYS